MWLCLFAMCICMIVHVTCECVCCVWVCVCNVGCDWVHAQCDCVMCVSLQSLWVWSVCNLCKVYISVDSTTVLTQNTSECCLISPHPQRTHISVPIKIKSSSGQLIKFYQWFSRQLPRDISTIPIGNWMQRHKNFVWTMHSPKITVG